MKINQDLQVHKVLGTNDQIIEVVLQGEICPWNEYISGQL